MKYDAIAAHEFFSDHNSTATTISIIRAGKKYTQGKTDTDLNSCVDEFLLAK